MNLNPLELSKRVGMAVQRERTRVMLGGEMHGLKPHWREAK